MTAPRAPRAMTYRVSTNRVGDHLWWLTHETISPGHTDIRDATPEEAALMDRIVHAKGAPSLADGERIRKLLGEYVPPLALEGGAMTDIDARDMLKDLHEENVGLRARVAELEAERTWRPIAELGSRFAPVVVSDGSRVWCARPNGQWLSPTTPGGAITHFAIIPMFPARMATPVPERVEPPAEHRAVRWHWLQYMDRPPVPMLWRVGALHGWRSFSGTTMPSENAASGGWRYVAPCIPPGVSDGR